MVILGQLILFLIDLYIFVIIAAVIVSWLLAFNVISPTHPQTQNLLKLLARLTDPVLRPVQKYVPSIGGIDLSPIIVIFALTLLKSLIVRLVFTGYF